MLKQALDKLMAEIAAAPKNKYVAVVGAYMMDHVRNHPEDAEKVMTEGKTIIASLEAMKAEAKKNQANGVGVLTDEEGYVIVLKYYGVDVPEAVPIPVPVAAPSISVTLDDLF
jgi:hypothetical protein